MNVYFERDISILFHAHTTGIDLALIAMADVAIVTYGSFGDFGGLLYKDKQEVLFPLGHPAHNETGVNDGVPTFQGIEWTLTAS